MRRIAVVTGGRDHHLTVVEADLFRLTLGALSVGTLRHGDAQGVDREAAKIAGEEGLEVIAYPYPRGQGKRGGPMRNREMLQGADCLIAFPGGRGTADCIRQARKYALMIVELESPRA